MVDHGRFAAKRILGDEIRVEADAFTDGHDSLGCLVRFRHESETKWREAPMTHVVNDRWRGGFPAEKLGRYLFTVEAWVDHFLTWRKDMEKRLDAGQEVTQELLVGAEMVEDAAARADGADRKSLERWANLLEFLAGGGGEDASSPPEAPEDLPEGAGAAPVPDGDGNGAGPPPAIRRVLSRDLARLMTLYPDRSESTVYDREIPVVVDRERARFSAWYELFPRSVADDDRHGTFADVEALLPDIREMGFDILYLPPIHPIGRTKRKGPNNDPEPEPGDPGSPWAIGAKEGGHKSIHPELGTLDDFRSLVAAAGEHDMEIALDIALQCSPDHPYVEEHPEWFRHRPDGSIRYAENPPKKYEDIYPIDFETDDWRALWTELASIFEHWIEQGVRVFRVDNPHTKPFAFWEWAIGKIKADHPDVIFLSEAFTRPKVMYRLGKLGFTQSYTYFTWRNSPWELRSYVEELTGTAAADFFRPNFWPNTPDILHEYLQTGGRGAFMARLVLASTLSSNYGIYGPAFELQESTPREHGSEEYLHSEKYQIRSWDRSRADSLDAFMARMNLIRRENPALQQTRRIRFHGTDNDRILAYSKSDSTGENVILTIVSFDPHHAQSGWIELDLEALGLPEDGEFVVHDLLGGQRFGWSGSRNYVALDPDVVPAHVFRIRQPEAARGGDR